MAVRGTPDALGSFACIGQCPFGQVRLVRIDHLLEGHGGGHRGVSKGLQIHVAAGLGPFELYHDQALLLV
jgi:hypothetical protein